MSPRLVRATGLAVLLMGTAACAPPDTSERGFGSTQVLHVRDPTLSLRRTFSLDESGIYLARNLPDVIVSNAIGTPYDRTLVTFATGVEEVISPGVMGALTLPSADGVGRTLLMWHFPSDDVIPPMLTTNDLQDIDLTFLDEVTGTRLTLSNVDGLSYDLGDTMSDPILLRRKGMDGNYAFLMGAPDHLVSMPSGLNQVLGRDRWGFVGPSQPADGMSGQAFSRIPFDGSAPVQLIPGTLTTPKIVSGPEPTTPGSTVVPGGDRQQIFCPAPSDVSPTPPCALFYDRRVTPNGSGQLPFVYLFDTGENLQLPGHLTKKLVDADILEVAPTGWDVFWHAPVGTTDATRLYAWHVGQDHAAACDPEDVNENQSFGFKAWRPLPAGEVAGPTTAAQFAMVAQPSTQTHDMPGSWTLITGTTGAECHVVHHGPNLIGPQGGLTYAPDGSALALLENDSLQVSKVYVTDGDAATPLRVVATGIYFFDIEFHDPRHLLLWHSNPDGYSLSWLDLSSTPAVEHPIADRVVWDARDRWVWINPRWVLLADADSTQDGSYSLHVIDIETGLSKLISRGVVDFWAASPPRAGATTLTVAYVVRSRSPSSQDGLWVAHLPLSDFPP